MAGHIAWACGLLSYIGLQGFALASDVTAQAGQIKAIQMQMVQRDIRDTKVQQCRARAEGNQAALTYATDTLENLRDTYRAITSREIRVPDCDEVIVSTHS